MRRMQLEALLLTSKTKGAIRSHYLEPQDKQIQS